MVVTTIYKCGCVISDIWVSKCICKLVYLWVSINPRLHDMIMLLKITHPHELAHYIMLLSFQVSILMNRFTSSSIGVTSSNLFVITKDSILMVNCITITTISAEEMQLQIDNVVGIWWPFMVETFQKNILTHCVLFQLLAYRLEMTIYPCFHMVIRTSHYLYCITF